MIIPKTKSIVTQTLPRKCKQKQQKITKQILIISQTKSVWVNIFKIDIVGGTLLNRVRD